MKSQTSTTTLLPSSSPPLGDTVQLGGRRTRRITCFAFIIMSIILVSAFVFLCLTFIRSSDYIVLRRYCVNGIGVDPSRYLNGPVAFHRTEPYVEWDMFHSPFSVGSVDIIGPVTSANPLSGPLYVRLCATGTTAPCIFASGTNLKQRINQLSTGQPLDDIVDRIVERPHMYKLRVNELLPNGTFVPVFIAFLGSLC